MEEQPPEGPSRGRTLDSVMPIVLFIGLNRLAGLGWAVFGATVLEARIMLVSASLRRLCGGAPSSGPPLPPPPPLPPAPPPCGGHLGNLGFLLEPQPRPLPREPASSVTGQAPPPQQQLATLWDSNRFARSLASAGKSRASTEESRPAA